ncbi:MAG: lipopolysaccharide biosynthesis protein [FCB group bacterium]|nr:lipopolysaccharide biosynthesis protein [FCB group bacterium]
MKKKNNTKFINNVSVLFSGNVINQIVLALSYPIIARLYSPMDFGSYEQINSILMMVLLIATMRFETTLLLAKNDYEFIILRRIAFGILFSMVSVVSLILLFSGGWLTHWLKNPAAIHYLFWVPVLLGLAGAREIGYNSLIYSNRFMGANLSDIFRSSGNSVLRIITGLIQASTESLFISRAVSLLVAMVTIFLHRITSRIKKISSKDYYSVLRKYRSYSFFMSTGITINRISTYFIPLLLSSYYGAGFLGLYAMANGTLNLPATVLRKSLNTVYLKEAAAQHNRSESLLPLFRSVTVFIFGVGILPLLAVIFWGPALYATILGQRWIEAGHISQIIVIWIFLSLLAVPSTAIISVIRMERFYAIFQAILLITRLITIFIIHAFFSGYSPVLIGLVVHGVLFNLLLMSIIYFKIKA